MSLGNFLLDMLESIRGEFSQGHQLFVDTRDLESV